MYYWFFSYYIWRLGVVVITAHLHSSKHQLRLCTGSSPARGVSEIRDSEDLRQWSPLEIRINAFRRSTIPQKQFIIIIISRQHMVQSFYQVNMKWLSSCKWCYLLSFCTGVSSWLREGLLDIGKKLSPKFSQIWLGHIQRFTSSKSTIETPEKSVNNMFKFWTYFSPFSGVSIVDLEQLNVSWVVDILSLGWIQYFRKIPFTKNINRRLRLSKSYCSKQGSMWIVLLWFIMLVLWYWLRFFNLHFVEF